MTTFTKFGAATLVLAAWAAPAAAIAPIRQATIAGTVVGSSDRLAPRSESWANEYNNLSQSGFGSIFFYDYFSDALGPYNDSFGIANGYMAITNSIMKAELYSSAAVSTVFPMTEFASSSHSISALNVDRITFGGIAPGKKAILSLTSVADVDLNSTQYGSINLVKSSQFSYSSDAVIYENQTAVTSETLGPKLISNFKVCDTCSGISFLKNGYRYTRTFFAVDNDDVLFITNRLNLGNSVAAFRSTSNAFGGGISQDNDFSNSGYTSLVFLTPGAEYLADSGEIYNTALPHGISAVPEPASWAMLIAGFGLTGAAMRQRRQAGHAVAA